eukprot:401590_1
MSHAAKQFVQDLFSKDDDDESKTVQIKDESTKTSNKSFKRANTNVGVMNRFILQFSRVEKAYRIIEESFILICRSETQKSLQERMKRKCRVKDIRPILNHLGFSKDLFSDDELKILFDKDVTTNAQISFQRILIGTGVAYFEKLKKDKEAEEENSGTEVEVNNDDDDDNKNNIVEPIDDENDDDVKESDSEKRYNLLVSGFDVVKKMFDVIDEDGSGEISSEEFKQAFTDICRDPEIVKQRMKELDYNNDQAISFREFIFGISSWCGFNDEMINDENDKDLDEPTSPKQPQQTVESTKN